MVPVSFDIVCFFITCINYIPSCIWFWIVFSSIYFISNSKMDDSEKEVVHIDRDSPLNIEEPKISVIEEKKHNSHKRQKGSDSDNEEKKKIPRTLDELGYMFNSEGKLREKKTDSPFQFVIKEDDHSYNQKRYEALGEAITEHIYELLENETHLSKVMVPSVRKENEPQSFVFMSENALKTNDKLLILIHGSGVVRAGQWARRLIINHSLESGTQLPYIKKAMEENYEVMVLNTNLNYVDENNTQKFIRENSSPEEHASHIWYNFVRLSPAKHVAIVAHSYGGIVTLDVINKFPESLDRIFAIAFTDSVHSMAHQNISSEIAYRIREIGQNWVSSGQPLDTPMQRSNYEIKRVSAGHSKHEMTSYSSMNSVFEFLNEKYLKAVSSQKIKSEQAHNEDL